MARRARQSGRCHDTRGHLPDGSPAGTAGRAYPGQVSGQSVRPIRRFVAALGTHPLVARPSFLRRGPTRHLEHTATVSLGLAAALPRVSASVRMPGRRGIRFSRRDRRRCQAPRASSDVVGLASSRRQDEPLDYRTRASRDPMVRVGSDQERIGRSRGRTGHPGQDSGTDSLHAPLAYHSFLYAPMVDR